MVFGAIAEREHRRRSATVAVMFKISMVITTMNKSAGSVEAGGARR
jgi:hypothetical protein